MNRQWKMYYLALTVRVVVAIAFIAASVYKINSPGAFAHQIYNFKILPSSVINPLAIVLPWLQLLCGLGLLFGRFEKGAILWIVLMLVSFQSAVASALIRGLNISCGCFKSGGSPATWFTFGRDSLLLLAALFCLWWVFRGKQNAPR